MFIVVAVAKGGVASGGDVAPSEEGGWFVHGPVIPDGGQVFVGDGGVDEGVVPREVTLGPVAGDGGELTDLEIEATVIPRGITERVFIETELWGFVRGIESAVESGLGEEVEPASGLSIQEEGEAGLKRAELSV